MMCFDLGNGLKCHAIAIGWILVIKEQNTKHKTQDSGMYVDRTPLCDIEVLQGNK